MKKSTIEGTIGIFAFILLLVIFLFLAVDGASTYQGGLGHGIMLGVILLLSLQCLLKKEDTWSWQRKKNK